MRDVEVEVPARADFSSAGASELSPGRVRLRSDSRESSGNPRFQYFPVAHPPDCSGATAAAGLAILVVWTLCASALALS